MVVSTQRRAAGLQRVDIEVRFDAPAGVSRRLWLELKWGDAPRPEQRTGYERELFEHVGNRDDRALIIAPWSLHAEKLAELDRELWRTWTDVGLLLQKVAAERGSVAAWLQQDFLNYLEEKDLSAHHGLTSERLAILTGFDKAREGFVALIARLDHRVEQEWQVSDWNVRSDGGRHAKLEHYRAHDAATDPSFPAATQQWMEFYVGPSVEPGSEWVLGAGFDIESPEPPVAMRDLCNSRLSDSRGFVLSLNTEGWWLVMRYLPLKELLVHADLDAQVDELVKFVEASWSVLSARPDFS